ncbi:unnamed protein product [Didymodactylos carnosus]|uniref:Uncharacterized protein n=1 Tax=Didymodactylos carnosus TaxID=1234261 RepID=A0A8S2E5L3_9BILA|nr:unnamed protein product [Didymodactylos carnosus]CAF3829486.1 unnamed protein product [Didymodactylos carnosus]
MITLQSIWFYLLANVFFLQCLPAQSGQYYIVKPHDLSALLGSNVTIPCVIQPPHGDVQWTKDGLALGMHTAQHTYVKY